MKHKRPVIMMMSVVILFLCAGCTDGESASSKPPMGGSSGGSSTSGNTLSAQRVLEHNAKIQAEDISIVAIKEILHPAYDHVLVEITNNSPYPLYFYPLYKIFEETGEKDVLVSSNEVELTDIDEDFADVIHSGETVKRSVYLGDLLSDEYTSTGNYKIELQFHAENKKTIQIEIVDAYTPLHTGISIEPSKSQYTRGDDEAFSYMIKNNSEAGFDTTLAIIIAQYQEDKWVRLPLTKKYYELHHNASLWSESCMENSQKKQEFLLSLADMVDNNLPVGNYRLEKQIGFDWYFAEFEVI